MLCSDFQLISAAQQVIAVFRAAGTVMGTTIAATGPMNRPMSAVTLTGRALAPSSRAPTENASIRSSSVMATMTVATAQTNT